QRQSLLGNIIKCKSCSRTYKHRRSLWRHVKYRCGKDPRFSCSREGCKFTAYLKENWKKHVAKSYGVTELVEAEMIEGKTKPHYPRIVRNLKFETEELILKKRRSCNICPAAKRRMTKYLCVQCRLPICLQCSKPLCCRCLDNSSV
ncbi:unnamed protein product, partial [Callosobruchus maculatus]